MTSGSTDMYVRSDEPEKSGEPPARDMAAPRRGCPERASRLL